jgi:hypothetical protein
MQWKPKISSFDYVASNAPKFLNWIDRRVDEAFDRRWRPQLRDQPQDVA